MPLPRIILAPKWRLKWLRSSRALKILPASIALASIKSRLKIQGIHMHTQLAQYRTGNAFHRTGNHR